MKTPYKILKLRSGEEIIARIRGEKQGKLILERPMIFKTIMIASPRGTQKEITILKNWLSFTNAIETKIPKDFIATYLEPDHTVVELYDMEKEKEDVKPNPPRKIIDAKDMEKEDESPSIFPPIDDELFEKMKKLTDENIQEMFEMLNDEMENTPFPPDAEEGEHMINISMFLPPEALLSLVEAGLLDIEDVQKMIDIMSNPQKPSPGKHPFGNWGSHPFKKYNGMNGKYTGDDENRKSADDYGMDWEDWSPDPHDYL
tara:strand:- start:417 stop:1190 length:774 start_codon:yes stop_codon:yes gene_type:complete